MLIENINKVVSEEIKEKKGLYNQQKTYQDHLSLKWELFKNPFGWTEKAPLLLKAALAWFFL